MYTRRRLFYENDGSGRDTFVNHAGAYWLNPLPAGVFVKSRPTSTDGKLSADNATSLVMDDNIPYLGRTLFGKSRYGTTLLPAGEAAALEATADSQPGNASSTGCNSGFNTTGVAGAGADGQGFDGDATALETVPFDVSHPERRLWQPGHATTGLDGTGGGSTYNGVMEPWKAPVGVDNTLLRLAPLYESSCHYQLRTGRFYTEDAAPPHELTLPEKGLRWGKSRYY